VRKMVMLLGLTMVLLIVGAGMAVAVSRVCNDIPCRGSENDDVLYEREGNRLRDRILGLEGEDVIQAATYTKDRDVVEGGRKDDRLLTNDGDGRDTARGDRGKDVCYVDPGDATSSCDRRGAADPAVADLMTSQGEGPYAGN
jgi:RTX calcium-binding nonapeptide repeat (4 copies)